MKGREQAQRGASGCNREQMHMGEGKERDVLSFLGRQLQREEAG